MGDNSPAPESPAQDRYQIGASVPPRTPVNFSTGNPADQTAIEIILRHMVRGTFQTLKGSETTMLMSLAVLGTTKKNSTSVFVSIDALDLMDLGGVSNGAARPALRELSKRKLIKAAREEDSLRHSYEIYMPDEPQGLPAANLEKIQASRLPLELEPTLFGARTKSPTLICPDSFTPESGEKGGITPESGAPESGEKGHHSRNWRAGIWREGK